MLNEDERIYVMEAVYKSMKSEMETGKRGNARGEFDKRMRRMYRTEGVKSRNAMLMGQNVGTVSVFETKPKDKFKVIDPDAFEDWLPEAEWFFPQFIMAKMNDFADMYMRITGENPPGCGFVAQPQGEPIVRLDVKPEMVAEVMGALPGDMRPLLGGE